MHAHARGLTPSAHPRPRPHAAPAAAPGSRRGAVPAASRRSADARLDLWLSLLGAAAERLSQAAGGAAAGAAQQVQRLVEPPPAGFPPGPRGDQAVRLIADPLRFLASTRAEHGPIVGLLMGGSRVVLVADREAAKQVGVRWCALVCHWCTGRCSPRAHRPRSSSRGAAPRPTHSRSRHAPRPPRFDHK